MATLPGDPSDLTPAWLSEVLGTEVVGVEVLDHAFATNQRARIGLAYARPDAGPASLFAKLAPLDPAHREMIGALGMAAREAQFYADVAPSAAAQVRVPRAHFAATADDGSFVILLEDLSVLGCRFSNGEWGVSADAAAGALEDLARFHGRFADPAARDAVAPWLAAPSTRRSDATAQIMCHVLDQHGDELTPAYAAVGELYVEHHAAMDDLWNAGSPTYVHGDPHIGNVFLDGERVGFLDWGLSRVATPLRDVSYFLTMTVDPDERRRAERDLWRVYLDALRASGGPDIGFADAWAAHRVHASYTVVATFLAFMPSYQTADGRVLGRALRTRAEQALDDLDVVDALRAALA
jgi:aminoglycoside phosphotransferase (APT) family kinase protein